MRGTLRSAATLAALALVACALPLSAQTGAARSGSELERLRVSDSLERTGDLAGSEAILRDIMATNPSSLSGLLALERVLRMQGRLEELLEPIEVLLAMDPGSAIGHQARLRTYSGLDRVQDIERAAEAWIRSNPRNEMPYREIARVWRQRGEAKRAAQVMERGRVRIGRGDALALELGDLYAEMGDRARVVREWELAIGPEARGLLLVRRRLASLPDGGVHILPPLVEALVNPPYTAARQRAAVELAMDAGMGERAEAIARRIATQLRGRDRQSFLVEIARSADGARLNRLALWAYSELGAPGGQAEQALAIRKRIAELSLAVGDTAAARAAYAEIERAFSAGSTSHREAAAVRVQLGARDGDPAAAARELDEFRRTYPDAPELDATAAAVATSLLERGEPATAERVLTGVRGPKSAVVRGRAALHRGDVPAARAAFLAAAPLLSGPAQTEALSLATLLGRLSASGGRLLADALGQVATDRAADGVALLAHESESLAGDERAALLDFAATLADRNELADEADRLRRVIIDDYATSLQAPGALLALARSMTAREPRSEEAAELLERLILEHPRSALVPQARRELDRLRGRIPST